MNTYMKPRTVIGVLFVVASLLKLATLWGILLWRRGYQELRVKYLR